MGLTLDGMSKETISAHPPPGGQTVLQFLLELPTAQEVAFSFSVGLPYNDCSFDGVFFKVLLMDKADLNTWHSTSRVG